MIVEKASDNKYFEIGDLVYWPRGDVEIVFSGALEKADGE